MIAISCSPTIRFASTIHYENSKEARAMEEFIEEGLASYYSDSFIGKPTASGEIYTAKELTAAHKFLPFGTLVRVRNLSNGKEIVVRINDRGPFVEGRIIDLSRPAAEAIDLISSGIARVRIETVR